MQSLNNYAFIHCITGIRCSTTSNYLCAAIYIAFWVASIKVQGKKNVIVCTVIHCAFAIGLGLDQPSVRYEVQFVYTVICMSTGHNYSLALLPGLPACQPFYCMFLIAFIDLHSAV